MNTDPDINTKLARLSRAVRFGLASLVLGLSYPNIHCALALKNYQEFFDQEPLGFAAVLMSQHQPLFVGLSILLPLVAIATIFTPGTVRSIYISGLLVVAVFVQLFFQWFTLMDPIVKMIGS